MVITSHNCALIPVSWGNLSHKHGCCRISHTQKKAISTQIQCATVEYSTWLLWYAFKVMIR